MHINLYRTFPIFLIFQLILIGIDSIAQEVLLPDTIRTCKVDSIFVEAEGGYNSYLWNTGETTQGIWINMPGGYSLSAINDSSVTIIDSTFIVIVDGRIIQEDTLLNCGDTIFLSGSSDLFNYFWSPGDTLADSIYVYPRTQTYYYANISTPGLGFNYCTDSVNVDIQSIIMLDTLIQLTMGCPTEPKAQIKVEASGGFPPYSYEWPDGAGFLPGDTSQAFGLTDGTKNVIITDTIGCFLDHEFEVKAHPIPDLTLYSDPVDTVYLQNPFVNFSYENQQYDSLGVDTFYVTWWEWNFGDSIKSTMLNPTHAYQQAGKMNVILKFRTFYNCPGTDSISIDVKPVKFFTPAVITPNDDQLNDIFEIWYDDGSGGGGGESPGYKAGNRIPIELNKYYISNTLIIFNRWGEKVYKTDNYENNWSPEGLNDGTYFYLFKCIGEYRTDVYKGSFYIITGSGY